MLRPVFYRNKGAYLVGRLLMSGTVLPILFALLHGERGIVVDAVLLDPDDVSIVFSFTRSYFQVELERPRVVIGFLRSIMPLKPLSDLYTSIGYNRHGKTELYRALMDHLDASQDRFTVAHGERGLVMIVFTLPSYELVFKVIKDSFSYPKTATRSQVMEKYRLVFLHQIARPPGRRTAFQRLTIHRDRFCGSCSTSC